MNTHTKNTGFTLLEVLIALAISSVVLVSVYSAFFTGAMSAQKADASFEVYQAARMIFNRIELDLRNSYGYRAGDSKFTGQAQSLSFVSIVDFYLKAQPYSEFSRVEYAFENKALARSCFRGLEALKSPGTAEKNILSAAVDTLEFTYLYPNPKKDLNKPYIVQYSWPIESSSEMGPDELAAVIGKQQAALPAAVVIRLVLLESPGKRQESRVEFTKTVALPMGMR